MKNIFLIIGLSLFISCKREVNLKETSLDKKNNDTIVVSRKHKLKEITCDMDGDGKNETIEIVSSTRNKKSGLKFIFGNGETKYLGMGKNVLNQQFDNFDWIGVFEIAPKGKVYGNNVDEKTGDILTENEIKEEDKVRLANDGVYVHAEESCGGGVIYWDNGKFNWIQQE